LKFHSLSISYARSSHSLLLILLFVFLWPSARFEQLKKLAWFSSHGFWIPFQLNLTLIMFAAIHIHVDGNIIQIDLVNQRIALWLDQTQWFFLWAYFLESLYVSIFHLIHTQLVLRNKEKKVFKWWIQKELNELREIHKDHKLGLCLIERICSWDFQWSFNQT